MSPISQNVFLQVGLFPNAVFPIFCLNLLLPWKGFYEVIPFLPKLRFLEE